MLPRRTWHLAGHMRGKTGPTAHHPPAHPHTHVLPAPDSGYTPFVETSLHETADHVTVRRCLACKQEKPLTDDFWVATGNGKPGGRRCRQCLHDETRERGKSIRAGLRAAGHPALQILPSAKQVRNDPSLAAQREMVLAARLIVATPSSGLDMTKVSPQKLSTAVALKHGADVIVREAPKVLALLALYASDPESPHHVWALQLFADRILPQRAFAALAIKEAGLDEQGGATPRVTINVIASSPSPSGGSGRVFTVSPERSEDDSDQHQE